MNSSEPLFERIQSIGFDDLDDRAIAAAKQLFLDGVAVGVAGACSERAIDILVEHFCADGAATRATVLGRGLRTSLYGAAVINGAAMHVLDFEPMWSPSNHAISTILPAILALVETRSSSGKEIATALVKGTEIQGWIREASRQYEPRKITFHPPGVVGPIGAVIATGHLLDLSPLELAHGVGIVASRAGSLSGNIGTMTKSAHCGYAAANGLDASLLAARGFTANPEIIGARQGYAEGFFPGEFYHDDLMCFGPPFRAVDPGYALKLFPSQFGTHFAIVAALSLREKLPAGHAIEQVTLRVPDMPYVNRPRPDTGLEGKFSFQYTAALALLDGHVSAESFSDERLHQADMQDMLERIVVEVDPTIPAQFERMHVEISARLRSGGSVSNRCDRLDGMWGRPVDERRFHQKVTDCLSVAMNDADIDRVLSLCSNLVELEQSDVTELIRLLGCFDSIHNNRHHLRKFENV